MIVGTAGHIDHGKTTLVRALTGTDTDRLPEEKSRGISIELGYAYMDAPSLADRIGFIDVPGHERLVHTMLAGATGIGHALLLVAADDGVMPQTREHLAVLSLLGVARGTVAITKVDRVDAARVAAVRSEVEALLAPTPLAAAPLLALSAQTGQCVAELRQALVDAARDAVAPVDDGRGFRLAIDRVFTLVGVGTVVTGTVHAGRVGIGDELVVGNLPARVRSLHAQNRAVVAAHAGQRAAVALAGVARDAVQRGQWLTAPALALQATRIDAELLLWHGESRPLRSGTPVQVHLGAASVPGSVAVLEAGDALQPGQTGRVQLVLRQPVGAWHGDRVVLRDAAASRTLAGGRVLDPQAPARYRRTPQRLAELGALAAPSRRLQALLAVAPHGVDLRRFAAAQGLADGVEAPAGALAGANHALGAAQAAAVRSAALQALADFHSAQPDELGPDAARLRRLAAPRLPDPLWRALLAALQAGGDVCLRGAFVHRPEHGVRLSAAEQRIAQKVAPLLATAGADGAWARDLARACSEPEPLLRTTLARLARQGELHQIVRDLYVAPAAMARLAALARTIAADGADQAVTAAAFRDASGLGRKRAIQVLEYLDRVGLLRRVGDVHRLRADSELFA